MNRRGDLWRAYALKEALRAIFAGDLSEDEIVALLDRFCSRARRSGMKPFVTLAQSIRKYRAGIMAAVRLGVNNARHKGLNRRRVSSSIGPVDSTPPTRGTCSHHGGTRTDQTS